ncbi:hypothetical protein ACSMXN_05700 [Jatrophihabitans sp. DSM 45814]
MGEGLSCAKVDLPFPFEGDIPFGSTLSGIAGKSVRDSIGCFCPELSTIAAG